MPITRTPYFSPTSIGGCALWLDAADTSTSSMTFSSGSNLSVWKDKSGSANDFSLTSGTPSSITDGGYSVVSIPSGAIMTSANQITFTTSSAFFIVSKLLTINPVSANINMLLAFNNISPYGNVGDFSIRFYQGVLQGSSTSGNPGNLGDVGNGNYYVNGTFNPNFDTTYYMNSYSIIDTIAPIQGGTSYIAISSSFYGRPFIGNVAEVIYYSGGVSASQRLQIEGYLAQKWGIQNQLPQGHIGRGAIIYRGVKIGTTTAPLYTQFSPTSIPGCGLWLDGADSSQITKSGSYITSIKEKVSGSVFTATGTTLTTSTINGVQSLNFPGTTYLSGAYTNPASAYLFIVFTVTSITNNAYSPFFNWKGPNDGTANIVGFGLTSGATVAPYQSDQGQQTPTYTVSLGSTYMMCFSFNGTATSLGINGQTPTSGTQPTPISAGSKTSAWICSDYNATTTVNIGELIVYNTSSLTTTQRQQIESYLAQKWGLTATLPGSHINNTQPAGLPANLTIATAQKGTTNISYISQILYYSVAPINWTNVWQPYLQQLVATNSGATASLSTYSVSGPAANYTTTSYGALAPNGLMYFIGGTGVFVLNPATNTATILGSTSTSSYSGLVLGTNGNLYGIPYGTGTVLVITPSTISPYGTVTTIGSGLDSYQGGCLGPNGTIYALPWSGANILTINTSTNTVTQVAISPYCYTRGSVLGPDGNIYGCPWASSAILKINTSTNTSSTISCDGGRYWGCCLAPNGLIYFSPFDAGQLISLNVFTNSVITRVSISNNASCSVVVGPNGKLYITGYSVGLYEYTIATNTIVSIGTVASSSGSSINLAPNGNLYIPGTSATTGSYVAFSGLSQLPNSNYCLSAYTNKF